MTVASLWKALDHAGCGKPVGAEDLLDPQRHTAKVNPWTFNERQRRHQRVEDRPSLAVDLSIWICETLTSTAMNEHNENPALHLVFTRTMKLLRMGIKLVVVVEGKRRIRGSSNELKCRRRRSGGSFWKACKECTTMLEFFGVPVVKAKAEGEALCALLSQRGIVDGVISNDGDCLLFGAKVVYTKFSIDNLEKGCVMKYEASTLCAIAEGSANDSEGDDGNRTNSNGGGSAANKQGTNDNNKSNASSCVPLSREDLVAFALLTGSDLAGEGIDNIGYKKALRFIRKCKLDYPLSPQSASMDVLKSWARSVQPIDDTPLADDNNQDYEEAVGADCNLEDSEDTNKDKTKKKKKKESCCSRCSHPGSKRSHEKHGCQICGTEPGEPCIKLSPDDKFRKSLRAKALALRDPKFEPTLVINAYMRPNDNQLPMSLVAAGMDSSKTLRMAYPKLREILAWRKIVKGHCLQVSQDYVKQSVARLLARTELFQNPVNQGANSSGEGNAASGPSRRNSLQVRERPIPKQITRKLVQSGIDCYEVCWSMQATMTDKDGEGIDGYEFSTIEPQDMVNRQHPRIVEAFNKAPKETKKPSVSQVQKRREFLEEFFQPAAQQETKPAVRSEKCKDQRNFNLPAPTMVNKGEQKDSQARQKQLKKQRKSAGGDVEQLLRFANIPTKSKTSDNAEDFDFSSIESESLASEEWLEEDEKALDQPITSLKEIDPSQLEESEMRVASKDKAALRGHQEVLGPATKQQPCTNAQRKFIADPFSHVEEARHRHPNQMHHRDLAHNGQPGTQQQSERLHEPAAHREDLRCQQQQPPQRRNGRSSVEAQKHQKPTKHRRLPSECMPPPLDRAPEHIRDSHEKPRSRQTTSPPPTRKSSSTRSSRAQYSSSTYDAHPWAPERLPGPIGKQLIGAVRSSRPSNGNNVDPSRTRHSFHTRPSSAGFELSEAIAPGDPMTSRHRDRSADLTDFEGFDRRRRQRDVKQIRQQCNRRAAPQPLDDSLHAKDDGRTNRDDMGEHGSYNANWIARKQKQSPRRRSIDRRRSLPSQELVEAGIGHTSWEEPDAHSCSKSCSGLERCQNGVQRDTAFFESGTGAGMDEGNIDGMHVPSRGKWYPSSDKYEIGFSSREERQRGPYASALPRRPRSSPGRLLFDKNGGLQSERYEEEGFVTNDERHDRYTCAEELEQTGSNHHPKSNDGFGFDGGADTTNTRDIDHGRGSYFERTSFEDPRSKRHCDQKHSQPGIRDHNILDSPTCTQNHYEHEDQGLNCDHLPRDTRQSRQMHSRPFPDGATRRPREYTNHDYEDNRFVLHSDAEISPQPDRRRPDHIDIQNEIAGLTDRRPRGSKRYAGLMEFSDDFLESVSNSQHCSPVMQRSQRHKDALDEFDGSFEAHDTADSHFRESKLHRRHQRFECYAENKCTNEDNRRRMYLCPGDHQEDWTGMMIGQANGTHTKKRHSERHQRGNGRRGPPRDEMVERNRKTRHQLDDFYEDGTVALEAEHTMRKSRETKRQGKHDFDYNDENIIDREHQQRTAQPKKHCLRDSPDKGSWSLPDHCDRDNEMHSLPLDEVAHESDPLEHGASPLKATRRTLHTGNQYSPMQRSTDVYPVEHQNSDRMRPRNGELLRHSRQRQRLPHEFESRHHCNDRYPLERGGDLAFRHRKQLSYDIGRAEATYYEHDALEEEIRERFKSKHTSGNGYLDDDRAKSHGLLDFHDTDTRQSGHESKRGRHPSSPRPESFELESREERATHDRTSFDDERCGEIGEMDHGNDAVEYARAETDWDMGMTTLTSNYR